MTFNESIRACLKKSVTFRGRASRSEFWWFTLALVLVHIAVEFLSPAVFGVAGPVIGHIRTLLLLFLFLPWSAAGYRRLHDIGWPGWPFLAPLTLTLFWAPSFFLMWFLGGDGRPASDVQFAAAQFFAIVFMVSSWATLPAWALLAVFLARAGDEGPNKYGPPVVDDAPAR